jgi:hypothetical protein
MEVESAGESRGRCSARRLLADLEVGEAGGALPSSWHVSNVKSSNVRSLVLSVSAMRFRILEISRSVSRVPSMKNPNRDLRFSRGSTVAPTG